MSRLVHWNEKDARADALGRIVLETGRGAVEILEAAVSEGVAGARVIAAPGARNAFGRRPLPPTDGSASIAWAAGLAGAGLRAAAMLEGDELLARHRDLRAAADRRLPLVAHVNAGADGHRPFAAVDDTGAFRLAAATPQEAADLALIAHRAAELALTPGIAAMDGAETAHALGPVSLPAADAIRAYLGDADELIDCPTPAQTLIFGNKRRRVPAWFSCDAPALLGAEMDSGERALHGTAGRAYFGHHVPELIARAMEEFATAFGRRYAPVAGHALDDAEHVLVVAGAGMPLARALADRFRKHEKVRLGVLGLTLRSPFPADAVAKALAGKRTVTVFDRTVPPDAGHGALALAVRATLGEAGRTALLTGIHGASLTAPMLAAAVRNALAGEKARTRFVLGVSFPDRGSAYPKREIFFQQVRREYPDLAGLTLPDAADPAPATDGARTLVIQSGVTRLAFPAAEERLAAALAHGAGADVVGRPIDTGRERGTAYRLVLASHTPSDPGDNAPTDVSVFLDRGALNRATVLDPVREGGTVVLLAPGDDAEVWRDLPDGVRARLTERRLALHVVDPGHAASDATDPADHEHALADRAVGAVLGALAVEGGMKRLAAHLEEAPERAARVREGHDEVRSLDGAAMPAPAKAPPREVPLAVRRFKDGGPPIARLSRFWSDTAPDFLADTASEPVADPFRAAAVLPAATASFFDQSAGRAEFPEFLAAPCTGCGKCLAACPHAAIAATVLAPEALLEAGLAMAQATGGPLTQLPPAVRPIAAAMTRALRKDRDAGETVGDLLDPSFSTWIEQKKLEGDKLAEARAEFARVMDAVGDLAVSATDFFFHAPETVQRGSGRLFSLAITPDACTGCLACVAACSDAALEASPSTAAENTRRREHYRRWEQLPDTDAETVRRAAADESYGAAHAHFLSRSLAHGMTGGDRAEPGSGEKGVLRWATTAIESFVQPHMHLLITEVGDLIAKLEDQIRGLFGDALPVHDLDALARGVGGGEKTPLRLDDLADRLARAGRAPVVDRKRLGRLIELVRSLRDFAWLLGEGPSGVGRARYGLAAGGDALDFGRHYPLNPFCAPVAIHWGGDNADFAAGLVLGHLRHALDNLRLVRRARLEATGRYDPRKHDEEIAGLDWLELTDEEWGAVPPLVLVGDAASLMRRGRGRLQALLASDAPVKVLLVDRGDAGLDPEAHVDDGLFALAARRAWVVRASTANPGHFVEGIREGLRSRRPALFHLYAPSPGRDGFAPDGAAAMARLALDARAFPCFTYDPDSGGVFGLGLSLAANPAPEADFVEREITHAGLEEGQTETVTVTLADWAFAQTRFRRYFVRLDEGTGAVSVDRWLAALDTAGLPPCITRFDAEGNEVRYRVPPAVADAARRSHETWRVLQELAGVVTPFTATVRERLAREIADEHAAELATEKADHEQELAAVEADLRARTAEQLKARLMQLSGYTGGKEARE